MEVGMLWFDNSSSSLEHKVGQAVGYYTQKYGHPPTHCLVHPKTLNGGKGTVAGVEVTVAHSVMPNHFWVGVDEGNGKPKSAKA